MKIKLFENFSDPTFEYIGVMNPLTFSNGSLYDVNGPFSKAIKDSPSAFEFRGIDHKSKLKMLDEIDKYFSGYDMLYDWKPHKLEVNLSKKTKMVHFRIKLGSDELILVSVTMYNNHTPVRSHIIPGSTYICDIAYNGLGDLSDYVEKTIDSI